MFDGKNNRTLDSFSLRVTLTVGAFATWLGVSYFLLAMA